MNMEQIRKNFERRGFAVSVFATGEDAARYLDVQIDGTSVAFGGSMTAVQLNLHTSLAQHNTVFHHWFVPEGMTRDEVLRAASVTDVYLTSANGVSEDGDLVNIDGNGNRVASTLFGHRRVYFLIGRNKIAPDLAAAIHRARNVAAPKNAARFQRKTPCVLKGGGCHDCNSPERICRGTVVISRPMSACRYEVVLIDEDLGY